MSEKSSVVIKYKTRKYYCHCCEQLLPNPKTSEKREFEFSEENIMSYAPWKEIIEYESDFREYVREFVYDTINFFATSSDDKILIEGSELVKVNKFIKKVVQSC